MLRKLPVLLALVLSACVETSEPLSLQNPQQSAQQSSLRLVNNKRSANAGVTALVGKEGGVLVDRENGHELVVPRGAVSEPTYFVMATAASDVYVVKLLAYRASDLSAVTRFDTRALTLRLSYAAAQAPSPRRLRVVYVSNDLKQILEVLSTSINTSKSVLEASINHFSIYSMAID